MRTQKVGFSREYADKSAAQRAKSEPGLTRRSPLNCARAYLWLTARGLKGKSSSWSSAADVNGRLPLPSGDSSSPLPSFSLYDTTLRARALRLQARDFRQQKGLVRQRRACSPAYEIYAYAATGPHQLRLQARDAGNKKEWSDSGAPASPVYEIYARAP